MKHSFLYLIKIKLNHNSFREFEKKLHLLINAPILELQSFQARNTICKENAQRKCSCLIIALRNSYLCGVRDLHIVETVTTPKIFYHFLFNNAKLYSLYTVYNTIIVSRYILQHFFAFWLWKLPEFNFWPKLSPTCTESVVRGWRKLGPKIKFRKFS